MLNRFAAMLLAALMLITCILSGCTSQIACFHTGFLPRSDKRLV